MAEEAEKDPQGSEGQNLSGRSPFITLLLILNLVAMATIAYFQYRFMQIEANRPDLTKLLKQGEKLEGEALHEQKVTSAAQSDKLVPLEGFTVNLAQGDGPRRYVRMNLVLKLSEDSSDEEIEARKPQIRDSVISILNAKKPEDLLQATGKSTLKEQIKSSINAFLIDGAVEDVFYTGFQIN